MRFGGVYSVSMRRGDKDHAAGVSSLTNEEPLRVVQSGVDIMREVVRKDCRNGSNCVIGEGKTFLHCGGYWFGGKGSPCAKNGDVGRDRGASSHWGSEILLLRRGDEDIVGVNGDIFMKGGEEESIKQLACNLGQSRRHHV